MSKVHIVANPATGQVITPSLKTPGYGTFRVDSVTNSFENGHHNESRRTAFIRGPIEGLEKLGLKEGAPMKGIIQRRESFEPMYEGHKPKAYPSEHAQAGEPVLTNGKETYLEFVYTEATTQETVWVGPTQVETPAGVQEVIEQQAV